jgi:hypothetical protein
LPDAEETLRLLPPGLSQLPGRAPAVQIASVDEHQRRRVAAFDPVKDATPEQIEEALIELAYTWGDIEEALEENDWLLADAVSKAFRVEVQYEENGWGDDTTPYVLFFDVADSEAREASRIVQQSDKLHQLITQRSRTWHTRDNMIVRVVPRAAHLSRGRFAGAWQISIPQPLFQISPTFRMSARTVKCPSSSVTSTG